MRVLLDGGAPHTHTVHANGEIPSQDRIRLQHTPHNVRQKNRPIEEDRPAAQREIREPCAEDCNSKIYQDGRSPQQGHTRNHLESEKHCFRGVPTPSQRIARDDPSKYRLNQTPVMTWDRYNLWPTATSGNVEQLRTACKQFSRQRTAGKQKR